jgi:hypothetical protein
MTWYFFCVNQNTVVVHASEFKQRWALLFNTCEPSGSSHDPRTICPGALCDFLQHLQANYKTVIKITRSAIQEFALHVVILRVSTEYAKSDEINK